MRILGLDIKKATPEPPQAAPLETEPVEQRASLSLPDYDLREAFIGLPNYSGRAVHERSALTTSAVFACIKVISESVAVLPLKLYRRLPDGSREEATDHPLHPILHRRPNSEQTAFEFWEMMVASRATTGNAFAAIEYNGKGEVTNLWPIRTDAVRVTRDKSTSRLVYKITAGGKAEPYDPVEIFHYRGRSLDGVLGMSPITYMRNAIGTALSTEEYAGRFFSNDATPGGFLETPNTLSDNARANLIKSLEARHRGAGNAHRMAVLEEGLKFNGEKISNEDSQFLQTRKFQVREIARFFRIPPHMIQDLEQATFSNIEEQSLSFLADTLHPWLVSLEQTIYKTLLSPTEQKALYCQFSADARLRTKTTDRYTAYGIALQNGWMNANEVRQLENMNSFEGGDVYRSPLNMAPAGEAMEPRSAASPRLELEVFTRPEPHDCRSHDKNTKGELRAGLPKRVTLAHSRRDAFLNAAQSILADELPEVRKIIEANRGSRAVLIAQLESFYKRHAAQVEQVLAPLYRSYASEIARASSEELGKEPPNIRDFADDVVKAAPKRWVSSSENQLRDVIESNPDAFADAATERLAGWDETRAEKFAPEETNRVGGAIARATFIALGATKLVSRTNGRSSCPYCDQLDGKVVSTDEAFFPAGASIEPDGLPPMKSNLDARHPPFHQGCDCFISPA